MSTRRLIITAVLAGSSQSEAAREYRGLPRLGQPAHGPLETRGRGSVRTTLSQATHEPGRDPDQAGHGDPAAADHAGGRGHGRGGGIHPLASAAPARDHSLPGEHPPDHDRQGLITPDPAKRPKSSYTRFEAAIPNQCWQSDLTHHPLADGTDCEIITWLDDCSRYALHLSAHRRITGPLVVTTFHSTCDQHGRPASTLTDNSMVYTTRLAGRPGRNGFETLLARWQIHQTNGRGSHPQTQGKVERFQQTLKK